MFDKYKLYLYAAAGILLLAVIGYIFYLRSSVNSSEKEIKSLIAERALLQKQVMDNTATIMKQQQEHTAVINANAALEQTKASLEKQAEELNQLLYREQNSDKKSLGELAERKPSLIENKVNKASENVLNCLENATGNKNEKCTKNTSRRNTSPK